MENQSGDTTVPIAGLAGPIAGLAGPIAGLTGTIVAWPSVAHIAAITALYCGSVIQDPILPTPLPTPNYNGCGLVVTGGYIIRGDVARVTWRGQRVAIGFSNGTTGTRGHGSSIPTSTRTNGASVDRSTFAAP